MNQEEMGIRNNLGLLCAVMSETDSTKKKLQSLKRQLRNAKILSLKYFFSKEKRWYQQQQHAARISEDIARLEERLTELECSDALNFLKTIPQQYRNFRAIYYMLEYLESSSDATLGIAMKEYDKYIGGK